MNFFQNMDLWKLNTLQDYIFYIIYVGSFVGIIWYAIKRINKSRNDASASKRVAKQLKKKGSSGKVYTNVTFDLGNSKVSYGNLVVDAAGIVAIKCIGRGLKIYGTNDDETWKVVDNKGEAVRIDNPTKELQASFDPLRKYLAKNGIVRVSIDPLTVFADPFDTPELYLGRDSGCIVFPEVKKWAENRKLRAKNIKEKLDYAAVIAALDKAVVPSEQK